MKSTYRMCRGIECENSDDLSYEELAQRYQKNYDPAIFAYFFTHLYLMIFKIALKYGGMPEEDLASIAMESLNRSLDTYDINVGSKFITLFTFILRNEIVKFKRSNLTNAKRSNEDDCRVLILETEYSSFFNNLIKDTTFEDEVADIDFMLSYQSFREELTESERVFVDGILAGKTSKEIAQMKNVTNARIYWIKKSLQDKYPKLVYSCSY